MTHRFDKDTEVKQVEDHRFIGTLNEGWWIVKGPNGGYLSAIILRSIMLTNNEKERTPRSLTVHFFTAPRSGPVEINTAVLRSGRSMTTITAQLFQDKKPVAMAICALGKPFSDIHFQDLNMPDVPPPQMCQSHAATALVPIGEQMDMVLAIGSGPWTGSDRAITGGWFRLKGERLPDSLLLTLLSDVWFPAIFTRVVDGKFAGAVPTIDLTIHYRAELPLPSSKLDDFYLGRFESTTAHQGYIEESGEVWSRDGMLLVQSRQLALLY